MGGRSFITSWLETKGGTKADLSRIAGKGHAYIQQFLGRGVPDELPEDVREKLAAHFGVSPNVLREGPRAKAAALADLPSDVLPAPNAPLPELRRLPLSARVDVIGVVEAGSDQQFVVNLTDGPIESVPVPAALVGVPDIFALFVAGESMAGLWAPGDIVYVSRRRPVTPGCFVVVELDNGPDEQSRMFLKQYVSRNDDKVRLVQYNPHLDLEVDAKRVRHLWRALHWRELVG